MAYTSLLTFRAIEWVLPADSVERIGAWRDWRSGLFFGGVSVAATLLGGLIGVALVGGLLRIDAWSRVAARPEAVLHFFLLSILISGLNWLFWKMRWKQQALQLQATESQLRLLQAQIEPHFLFNTLANVQSLIEYDTPRAKQMLEAFTDYLRASLGQLRHADSSLGAELEMGQAYLRLLQIRMDERLRFEIEADAEARAAVLPPLLLQPLIENAIHHGLEPKIEGGCVRIRAAVAAGRLEISVDDDGLGPACPAPARPRRRQWPGAGEYPRPPADPLWRECGPEPAGPEPGHPRHAEPSLSCEPCQAMTTRALIADDEPHLAQYLKTAAGPAVARAGDRPRGQERRRGGRRDRRAAAGAGLSGHPDAGPDRAGGGPGHRGRDASGLRHRL